MIWWMFQVIMRGQSISFDVHYGLTVTQWIPLIITPEKQLFVLQFSAHEALYVVVKCWADKYDKHINNEAF